MHYERLTSFKLGMRLKCLIFEVRRGRWGFQFFQALSSSLRGFLISLSFSVPSRAKKSSVFLRIIIEPFLTLISIFSPSLIPISSSRVSGKVIRFFLLDFTVSKFQLLCYWFMIKHKRITYSMSRPKYVILSVFQYSPIGRLVRLSFDGCVKADFFRLMYFWYEKFNM